MFQGQPGTKSTVKFEVASRATSARKAAMGSGTRCGASFDRLLVVALAGLLASLAGCVIAVGSFGETERLERSFDVDPSPHAERLQQLTIERDRILAQLNGGGDRLRVTATHGSIELHSR